VKKASVECSLEVKSLGQGNDMMAVREEKKRKSNGAIWVYIYISKFGLVCDIWSCDLVCAPI